MIEVLSLIVSRDSNWFDPEDMELSPYYCAMSLLEKLSTRQVVGLKYDRIKLTNNIIDRSTLEAIKTIDASLVMLISRGLVQIKNQDFAVRILITEKGLNVFRQFKGGVERCG